MKVVVGCIVEDEGKILMVREGKGRNKGKWNFPIGHLKDEETLFEGALRETLEESGCRVQLTGFLPITETLNERGKYILIRFTAELVSFDSEYVSKDIMEIKWMDPSEILKLQDFEFRGCNSNRKMVEYFTKKQTYPLSLLGGNYYEE